MLRFALLQRFLMYGLRFTKLEIGKFVKHMFCETFLIMLALNLSPLDWDCIIFQALWKSALFFSRKTDLITASRPRKPNFIQQSCWTAFSSKGKKKKSTIDFCSYFFEMPFWKYNAHNVTNNRAYICSCLPSTKPRYRNLIFSS